MYGASFQAITYRCKDLGIISPALMGQMFDEFTELGWRDPPYEEEFAMPSERSERFERLCLRALAEKALSPSQASELLEVSVCDLHRRMRQDPQTMELTEEENDAQVYETMDDYPHGATAKLPVGSGTSSR